MREIKLFMAYAPEDEEYKEELSKHLSALKEDGHIAEWSAVELLPGADQMAVLRKKMGQSDIIALLLSADFLGSDHGKDLEEMAFAQKAKKGTVLVPIKIRAVPLSDAYAQFSMLPDQSRPVDDTSWGSRDMAYMNIAEGIKRLAISMQNEEVGKTPTPKPATPPSKPDNDKNTDFSGGSSAPAPGISKKLVLGIVGVVILALAIWLVPPMLKDKDKIAYDAAKTENSIESYNSYVKQFPEGSYVTEAQRSINDLTVAQEKEIHDKAWAEAQEVDDITAYKIYLRDYPEGANKVAASERIIELSTAEAEDAAFKRAEDANNVNAYLHYLNEYPSGRHIEESNTGIKALLTTDGWAYYGKTNSSGNMDDERYFDQMFDDNNAKPEVGNLIKSRRALTIRRGPASSFGSSGSIPLGKIAEIVTVEQVSANAYYVKIEY